jgi:hypothetical protein
MLNHKPFTRILVQISANLKVLELYLLNILLIAFMAVCLWALPQSGDLLVKASEATAVFSRFYLMSALYFYVFITWYTARAVAWQSKAYERSYFSSWMMLNLPRLMGYYIYSVFVLSYLDSPLFLNGLINLWGFLFCIVFDFFLFLVLAKLFHWKSEPTERMVSFYNFLFWFNILLIFLCALTSNKWGILLFVVGSQGMFIFLVVNRDKALQNTRSICPPGLLNDIFLKLKVDENENLLFTVLQFVYTFGLFVYLSAVIWLRFAINAGTITILFCALGVIGGAINLLKTLSFIYKVNLLLLLVFIFFIFGFFSEPHKVKLYDTGRPRSAPFQARQNFDEYLKNWMDQHAAELKRDSIVPMIFVHADGGASRSGYWVASVLSKLEDQSGFSHNLFCLSGASGGTVGNATFFSLLYLKEHSRHEKENGDLRKSSNATKMPVLPQAQQFLSTDFLSYTLARMLGPGAVLNLIAPIIPDRARALERSLEQGAKDSTGVNRFFNREFSSLLANKNDKNYRLPILSINVTRMQDGNPALISNIYIDSSVSKARLDILGQIQPGKDMRLSTATILSARFPYLSPAGLIVQRIPDPVDTSATVTQHHYYVDGGYFDNSGAGVIQEMIQKIERLKNDTAVHVNTKVQFDIQQLKKLRYVIIHITNTRLRKNSLPRIHPFKNDLFAPIVTIAGTYGSQTAVNNSRLEDYYYSLNKNDKPLRSTGLNEYFDINLYTKDPKESYPMNWVISNSIRRQMDYRLNHQDTLKKLIDALKLYYLKHPQSQH